MIIKFHNEVFLNNKIEIQQTKIKFSWLQCLKLHYSCIGISCQKNSLVIQKSLSLYLKSWTLFLLLGVRGRPDLPFTNLNLFQYFKKHRPKKCKSCLSCCSNFRIILEWRIEFFWTTFKSASTAYISYIRALVFSYYILYGFFCKR